MTSNYVRLNWVLNVLYVCLREFCVLFLSKCSKTSFLFWLCSPARAMASSSTRFLDHTQRRATIHRTPLDEWSARRRDLYLTTHNTYNNKYPRPPLGFEITIAAGRAAIDLRLIPRGHWDRHSKTSMFSKDIISCFCTSVTKSCLYESVANWHVSYCILYHLRYLVWDQQAVCDSL
jgi:hypothetical protein